MGQVAVEWTRDCFGVLTDRASLPVEVNGVRRRDFGVYTRSLARPRRAAYLVHVPTGVGLGAFECKRSACLAADIVEAVTNDESPDWACIGGRIIGAWQRAGFYPSHATDDSGNPIWGLLSGVAQRGAGHA